MKRLKDILVGWLAATLLCTAAGAAALSGTVAALNSTPTTAAAPGRTPTVALIPGLGERVPLEADFARVEVALSTNGSFRLVERAQVRRVLAEQELTAAGLARAEHAAALGRLLAADLFVFVEQPPGGTNRTWRVQLIESRTGLALGHLVATGEALARDPAPLVSALVAALAKCGVPLAERHYLGVLGLRSEEIGRALDPLANLLEAWLPFDLATGSNVVLLDRLHLERLTTEETLSGLELQLKGSAVLVRGTLKRMPDAPLLLVRLAFQSPELSSLPPLTLTLATNDLPTLRRAVAAAVFGRLHVAPPAATALESAREAALFSDRARALFLDGEYEAAAQAGEAAWALAPNLANQMKAAELHNEAALRWLNRAEVPGVPRDRRGHPRLSPEANLHILRHAARAAELYRAVAEAALAEAQPRPNPTNSFPRPQGSTFLLYALRLPLGPGESEALELRHELQRQSLAFFRLERNYYAALWNVPTNGMKPYQFTQSRWSYLLANSLPSLQDWTDDPQEWTRLLREVVTHYQHPPGPFTLRDEWGGQPSRFIFWYHLSLCPPVQKFAAAEDHRVFCEALEPLTRLPPSALHLAAMSATWTAQTALDPGSAQARARQFLDRFLRDYPYDHAVRRQDDDYWFPSLRVTSAVLDLPDLQQVEHYERAILEPILAARDGVRLCSWDNLLLHWLNTLDQNGRRAEAHARAQLALNLIPPELRVRGSGMVASLRPRLSQIRDRVAPRQHWLTGEWAGWELTQLASNAPPKAEMVAALFQPGRLLALWVREEDTNHAVLRLTAQPLTGGPLHTLGEAAIQAVGRTIHFRRAVALATEGTLVCVGTGAGGLVVFRDGHARLFTDTNGLPANDVRAVACLGGQIYLGFPEGLASLDPRSGRVTELAARRSTERRNPFDGQHCWVQSFLADPDRQCVWMSFSSGNGDRKAPLHGLWKYTPKSRSFEKHFAPPSRALASLSFQRGHLVGALDWPNRPPVVAFAPQTGQPTWLLRSDLLGMEPALFGRAVEGDLCWLWRGDELLSGGAMLSRRTRSQPVPATLSRTPDGQSLSGIVAFSEPTPGPILFATTAGELWQLRPPSDSSPPRPQDATRTTTPQQPLNDTATPHRVQASSSQRDATAPGARIALPAPEPALPSEVTRP